MNISYPGMVLGPPAGDQFGEAAEGVQAALKMRGVPGRNAAWIVVDVRDLAALHVALLQPGQGPRRYMAGGRRIAVDRLAFLLGAAANRDLVVYPVPDVGLRALGRLFDVIGDHLPFETPINSAAMQYYTQMPPGKLTNVVFEQLATKLNLAVFIHHLDQGCHDRVPILQFTGHRLTGLDPLALRVDKLEPVLGQQLIQLGLDLSPASKSPVSCHPAWRLHRTR